MSDVPHPPIASREEWLQARLELLKQEKALTAQYDRVNALRRRLPMVKIEKPYLFSGPNGEVGLLDLFEGQRQLIVYHFMFDPTWMVGCPGCTGRMNAIGDLSMLEDRDTTFVMVSRATYDKLRRYKAQHRWTWPWYSSLGSDFNYDFQVTLNKKVTPLVHNYNDESELERRKQEEPWFFSGETHGLSVFFQLNDEVFHTYSTYARGIEGLTDSYRLLDRTPYGRQEDFEDSPPGWPQRITYS